MLCRLEAKGTLKGKQYCGFNRFMKAGFLAEPVLKVILPRGSKIFTCMVSFYPSLDRTSRSLGISCLLHKSVEQTPSGNAFRCLQHARSCCIDLLLVHCGTPKHLFIRCEFKQLLRCIPVRGTGITSLANCTIHQEHAVCTHVPGLRHANWWTTFFMCCRAARKY
jgi:hypothetical protein